MIVLDTDVLSNLQRYGDRVSVQLRRHFPSARGPFCVTVITFEEQLRGRLGNVSAAKSPDALIRAYARLMDLRAQFMEITMLAYDPVAHRHYESLRHRGIRIGAMDLRIAAIVMAHDATLVTRNVVDFRKVPGLKVEDWAALLDNE